MPCIGNAAHQLWIALRDPAEGEEGGLGLVACQQRQDAIDVAFDTAFALIPVAASNVGRESGDLKVVLDIDRQGVAQQLRPGAGQSELIKSPRCVATTATKSLAMRSAAWPSHSSGTRPRLP